MTLVQVRYYIEVLINGTPMRTGPGVTITEALESFCTVAEFELLERPASVPADGDTVEIRQVNLDTSEFVPLFGGYITIRGVNSSPHALAYRAIDELSKFSAIRNGTDLELTGMTDGEAWKAIATVCGVTFDPADIQDTGYVLGERAPVYWKVGQTGATVIGELDKVFGCKSLTVLNNRVVRFAYDRVPHLSDSVKNFSKTTSPDMFTFYLETADDSAVQSEWKVTGGQLPCGDDDECTCTPWARSATPNPKRGKKIKLVPGEDFQSTLIQDEELAAEISRRLMRWYNRVPIDARLETITDPDIHPGSVVGVFDPTYGIGHTATLPFFVQNVDKRGHQMTLTLVGGTAGATGTTTTGVDKVCNNVNLDLDWPGDWDFPPLSFPPLGLPELWTGTESDGISTINEWAVEESPWEIEFGAWTLGEEFVWSTDDSGQAIWAAGTVGATSISVTTTIEFLSFVDEYETAWISLIGPDGDYVVEFYGVGIQGGVGGPDDWTADAYYPSSPGYSDFTTALDTTVPFDVEMVWTAGVGATVTINSGEFVWNLPGTELVEGIRLVAGTRTAQTKYDPIIVEIT